MPESAKKIKYFEDYKDNARVWITLSTGEYYPDILADACQLYGPVLVLFKQLLETSESSGSLFLATTAVKQQWMRIQLARVFRKYVSPETPVELLKKKTKAQEIIDDFGKGFRPIHEVQAAFYTRPLPDEALCALLWEYKDRGKKGYDLTERLFDLLEAHHPDLEVLGPKRAGQDILAGNVFENYPNPSRPLDFIIKNKEEVLAVGLARYDGDRGGAQEDDRTGGYNFVASEFLTYAQENDLDTKVIFVNDGPGLLLGSMWNDYAKLERSWEGKIMVTTLRMLPERLTSEWLKSDIDK
jgi:hypothetical protein